jgi:hypothetical protein
MQKPKESATILVDSRQLAPLYCEVSDTELPVNTMAATKNV